MRENESECVRRIITPGVDIACIKFGRKYACMIGSSILVDFLAYEFILVFEEIGFDSAVDEI